MASATRRLTSRPASRRGAGAGSAGPRLGLAPLCPGGGSSPAVVLLGPAAAGTLAPLDDAVATMGRDCELRRGIGAPAGPAAPMAVAAAAAAGARPVSCG